MFRTSADGQPVLSRDAMPTSRSMAVAAPHSSSSTLSLFHVQLHIAAIVLNLDYVYHFTRCWYGSATVCAAHE
jgi:hypothetical protein